MSRLLGGCHAGLCAAAYCCGDVFTALDDSHEKVGRQTVSHFLSSRPAFGTSANENCHPELLLGEVSGERVPSGERPLLLLGTNVWECIEITFFLLNFDVSPSLMRPLRGIVVVAPFKP